MVKLHNDDMPIDEEFIRKRVDAKDVDDSILLEILSKSNYKYLSVCTRNQRWFSKRELATLATTKKSSY